MPITQDSATDEIYGIVKSVVDSASAAIVGYVPEIRWPGEAEPSKPDPTKFWLRVSTKTVVDSQSSLTDGNGTGTKRYTNVSLLFVQVFAPRSMFATTGQPANKSILGEQLAIAIRDKFREPNASPSGAIWFRDQKVVALQAEPDYYPFNVQVTFQFDTIQ
jgi:hypothetical protein